MAIEKNYLQISHDKCFYPCMLRLIREKKCTLKGPMTTKEAPKNRLWHPFEEQHFHRT